MKPASSSGLPEGVEKHSLYRESLPQTGCDWLSSWGPQSLGSSAWLSLGSLGAAVAAFQGA